MEGFEGGDSSFIKKMLGNIEQETYRAKDFVLGLLEFSRVKEFELHPANIPMDSQRIQEVLITMIINASQTIAGDSEIFISASIERDRADTIIQIAEPVWGLRTRL